MHKLYVPESELTYGQKYILDLMEKKQLAAWCRDLDNLSSKYENYAFSYLFHIGVGQIKMPPADIIFKLRHLIFPSYWFYTTSESKPEQKSLTKMEEEFDIEKSVNFKILKDMYEEKKLYNWCSEHNLNYVPFSHVFNSHYGLSVNKMKKLREYFPPENWFIYCNE